MKKLITLIAVLLLMSCLTEPNGKTLQILEGNESNLLEELKGLKVYNVKTDGGPLEFVRVAVLSNSVSSLSYPVGKYQETTILVTQEYDNRRINVKEIIFENDTMIIAKK